MYSDSHLISEILTESQLNCPYVTTSDFLKCIPPSNSVFNFSLINFNVRSLNSNKTYLDTLLESLNNTFQIIKLTETWVTPDIIELSNIEGYLDYHSMRGSRGGGVEILCKNSLQSKQIRSLSHCEPHIESCAINIETGNETSTILGIKWPPQVDIDLFLLSLEHILEHDLVKNSKTIIIAGDINIDLLNQNSTAVQKFKSGMHSHHFLPVILRPTRIVQTTSSSSATLLDQICVYNLRPFQSGIILSDITDHLPSYAWFSISENPNVSDKIRIEYRPFSTNNLNMLKTHLSSTNWNLILDTNDVNIETNKFIHVMNEAYSKFSPRKVKYISTKRL